MYTKLLPSTVQGNHIRSMLPCSFLMEAHYFRLRHPLIRGQQETQQLQTFEKLSNKRNGTQNSN